MGCLRGYERPNGSWRRRRMQSAELATSRRVRGMSATKIIKKAKGRFISVLQPRKQLLVCLRDTTVLELANCRSYSGAACEDDLPGLPEFGGGSLSDNVARF